MRNSSTACIVFFFAMLQMHGGCSVISKLKPDKTPAKRPSIQFTAWLEQPIAVPIEPEATLASFMASSEVESGRFKTKAIDIGLKSAANSPLRSSVSRQFEDGCIVLTRGNSNWYFFDPIQIMEIFTGAIPLNDGDKVYTLPFFQCKFVMEQPNSPIVYVFRDLDGSTEAKSVQDSRLRSMIAAIPPTPAWNVTVVTRTVGNEIHHLVLPAPIGNVNADTKKMLSAITLMEVGVNPEGKAAYINNGDVIENLSTIQFQRRL